MQGLPSVRRSGPWGWIILLGAAVFAAAATAEEPPPVPAEAATVRPIDRKSVV